MRDLQLVTGPDLDDQPDPPDSPPNAPDQRKPPAYVAGYALGIVLLSALIVAALGVLGLAVRFAASCWGR